MQKMHVVEPFTGVRMGDPATPELDKCALGGSQIFQHEKFDSELRERCHTRPNDMYADI
jgi:hypothetical protein